MALAITSFTPATGPTTGGTKIVVTGTQLDTADVWLVGAHEASIDITATNAATSVTILAPAIANTDTLVVKIFAIDNDTSTEAASASNYTYTVVSSPTLTSTLARKWRLDVDSSSGKDGTGYIQVRGIRDFQPTLDATTQDDSDYDNDTGYGSDVRTQLKWKVVAKLGRKMAPGFVEDPGQKVIRDAHDQFSSDAVVRVRWYDRNGTDEAYEGYAMVTWAEDGGDTTQLSTVSLTLMGQGPRVKITNPA